MKWSNRKNGTWVHYHSEALTRLFLSSMVEKRNGTREDKQYGLPRPRVYYLGAYGSLAWDWPTLCNGVSKYFGWCVSFSVRCFVCLCLLVVVEARDGKVSVLFDRKRYLPPVPSRYRQRSTISLLPLIPSTREAERQVNTNEESFLFIIFVVVKEVFTKVLWSEHASFFSPSSAFRSPLLSPALSLSTSYSCILIINHHPLSPPSPTHSSNAPDS